MMEFQEFVWNAKSSYRSSGNPAARESEQKRVESFAWGALRSPTHPRCLRACVCVCGGQNENINTPISDGGAAVPLAPYLSSMTPSRSLVRVVSECRSRSKPNLLFVSAEPTSFEDCALLLNTNKLLTPLARLLSFVRCLARAFVRCALFLVASKGKESGRQTNTIIKIKLYLIVNELSCVSSPFNLLAHALNSWGKTARESQ